MAEAELIEDLSSLQALEPAWWDLWRRCPAAHPFQSPAWLIPWWRCFHPGRLATVAISEAGRLAALAPVYVEDGELGRRLLPIGIGVTDYLDVLCEPSARDAVGELLVTAARDLVPDWERWELEELSADAVGLALPVSPDWDRPIADQSAAPVLALEGERLSGIPSSKRRKLRMSEHRVQRRGGLVREVALEGISAFLDDLIRLHGARWTARGEGGVLESEQVRRFHQLALPQLAAAGLARLYVLEIEAKVVGAYYGLHHGYRAYAYLGGFDPDYAFESPGTVLMGYAIRTAAGQGAREFHFLRGQEAYKYDWGAVDRWTRRRTIKRPAS